MGDVLVQALGNTFAGIGTVFCVLILICVIIYCFKFIAIIQDSFTKKPEIAKKPQAAPAPVAAAPKKAANKPAIAAEPDVPVAVIMAAITAYEESVGYPEGSFVVRSIKRRK